LQPFINVFVAVSIIQLLPFPELYAVFPSSTSILVNPMHPNARESMLVTLFGISILVNPLQLSNALSHMIVTLFGISILVNPLHPENANFPMYLPPFITIVLRVLGTAELAKPKSFERPFTEDVPSPKTYGNSNSSTAVQFKRA